MYLVARYRDRAEDEEIRYWRKHVRLHAWMEALYEAKGGSLDDFNCGEVELTVEDLGCLAKDLDANLLPLEARGFKTGLSDFHDLNEDLTSVASAKQAAGQGAKIIYWPSW